MNQLRVVLNIFFMKMALNKEGNPKPIEPREDWEIEFDNAVSENYRGQDPYWPDWDGVKSFIRTHKALWERQARKEYVSTKEANEFAKTRYFEGKAEERARLRNKVDEAVRDITSVGVTPQAKSRVRAIILFLLDGGK